MRRSAALLATTLPVIALLTACSTAAPAADCTVTPGGDVVELVTPTFNADGTVLIDYPTPLVSTELQYAVTTDGDGAGIRDGDYVTLRAAATYTETAAPAAAAQELSFVSGSGDLPSGVQSALSCSTEGDVIVVAGSVYDIGPEAYELPEGQEITEEQQLAVDEAIEEAKSRSAVYVLTIDSVIPGRAEGANQWVTTGGLPALALAPDGTPGITIPNHAQPEEFISATTIKGQGAVVEDGDTVALHYSGWTWEGDQFDTSWDDRTPLVTTVGADASLITGFSDAVVGQTVGSQVIAVIPAELGYGDAGNGSTIPGGATLIFVIDILAVQD